MRPLTLLWVASLISPHSVPGSLSPLVYSDLRSSPLFLRLGHSLPILRWKSSRNQVSLTSGPGISSVSRSQSLLSDKTRVWLRFGVSKWVRSSRAQSGATSSTSHKGGMSLPFRACALSLSCLVLLWPTAHSIVQHCRHKPGSVLWDKPAGQCRHLSFALILLGPLANLSSKLLQDYGSWFAHVCIVHSFNNYISWNLLKGL
jgi:hypothetical protein